MSDDGVEGLSGRGECVAELEVLLARSLENECMLVNAHDTVGGLYRIAPDAARENG
jgi:hypothetical protein